MNLSQDIRDVVSGFTGLFTTQDVIDSLPGYKSHSIRLTFRQLIYQEGIAEDTTPFNFTGLYRVVRGNESIRRDARNAHPITIDGKHYPTEVAGCREMKWNVTSLSHKFTSESNKVGYHVHTISFFGHTVTRGHNT